MGAWLAHHGIKGQKWGVRRFQNKDGTLTEAGKARQNMIDAHNKMNELNDEYTKSLDKWSNELVRLEKKKELISVSMTWKNLSIPNG